VNESERAVAIGRKKMPAQKRTSLNFDCAKIRSVLFSSFSAPSQYRFESYIKQRTKMAGVLLSASASDVFSIPQSPDRLWGPSRVLYNSYPGSFPEGKVVNLATPISRMA
jgi:hypothetical protein